MKHGDFTQLATHYHNRPGYSKRVLRCIAHDMGFEPGKSRVADVGAGTGKLTLELLGLGFEVTCVEPNDAMRAEGENATATHDVPWHAGSAEDVPLPDGAVDWLLMGSSFHWADPAVALPEFHRVLRPGGAFTAVWNPRDLDRNPLHAKIEARIKEIVPNLKRVSSGGRTYTEQMYEILPSTGHFENVVFVEAQHEVRMTPERYMGAWESVNDIQVQAGTENWPRVLDAIRDEISDLSEVVVPYRTRAFTAMRRNVPGSVG